MRKERRVTAWNHLRAIVLLPLMNVVLLPSLILWLADDADPIRLRDVPSIAAAAGGLALAVMGAGLTIRSIGLFVRCGKGTLAPWDPTRTLITAKLYTLCRNPMKLGLFLMLAAECVLLGSTALVYWTGAFIAANVVYIRLWEEPGLRARFGRSYEDYCAAVPRWFPRLGPLLGRVVNRSKAT